MYDHYSEWAAVKAVFDAKVATGDKFGPADVDDDLRAFGTAYLRGYSDTFSFVLEMRDRLIAGRRISDSQWKGVLNTALAPYRKQAAASGAAAPPAGTVVDLTHVPPAVFEKDGRYYRVDKPTKGTWAGFTFVKSTLDKRLLRSKHAPGGIRVTSSSGTVALPTTTWTADMVKAVEEYAADPGGVLARSGVKTGVCGVCSRDLTDPESVRLGIGPVCIKKYGLNVSAAPTTPVAPPPVATVTVPLTASPECRAHKGGRGFLCTEKAGHPGPHIATETGGNILSAWYQTAERGVVEVPPFVADLYRGLSWATLDEKDPLKRQSTAEPTGYLRSRPRLSIKERRARLLEEAGE